MEKAKKIISYIFSIGILVCLFAGAVSVIGYICALVIGGETAELLCSFIYKTYFPIVIKATTVFAFIGLLSMYLNKQKALSMSKSDK